MATDLSLLFRLRGDNTQLKGTIADSKQAVNQLRQAFGPQLTQTVTVANQTFSSLNGTLQNFVTQRAPLVGGAIVSVTDKLRGLGGEGVKADKAFSTLGKSIGSIAAQSGKSIPQVAGFLSRFVQLETQAQKNEAAFKFFGGSVDLIGNKTAKFVPELNEASTALAAVSAGSTTAAARIAAMAGPIGIAAAALTAMALSGAAVAKQLFELTKNAADFQGKMFDLAQQTGLAVETLSAFEVVAQTTGGNLATITQALVSFQRKLDDAQDPLGKTAELFRKFDISTSDTETSLRSAFTALARMPEGFAQTNAAAELFGSRGGKQVLAILKEANGDIDGTITRLREMGILISEDAARAADKFNDELELLNFQLRALSAAAVNDLVPAMTDIIRETGNLVRVLRPLVSLLAPFAKVVIGPTTLALKSLSLMLAIVTRDYKALAEAAKEAKEAQEIPPVNVPGPAPVPLPGQPPAQQAASEAVNEADVVLAEVKRRVAAQNEALDELFQRGRRDRDAQAREIVAGNKRVLEADQARLDALLRQKEIEIKALDEAQEKRGEIVRRDTDDYRAITAQIVKLQQERLDKENEFEVTSRAIRAKAAKENADAQRNQIANDTDLFNNEIDRQIKSIEASIQRGATVEREGLAIIEQLEQSKIDARIESLEEQRRIGFLTVQNQKDLDNELIKLGQERDRLLDEQGARRLQRDQAAAERQRDILISNIDALLQITQIRGQRIIDAQAALAEARVITEEQAAKKILEINLGLIDAEIEATKAKLEAAKSIVDVKERTQAEADLNNQIKILTEERVSIQAAGEREIEAGRERDLQNFRDYADELRDLTEQVTRIQREAAEEAIRLLRINFANRRDIVRAQADLDKAEEGDRHQRAIAAINKRRSENDGEIRVLERRLQRLKIGTHEEIAEHERILASLDNLRLKQSELDRLREAEAERHRLVMEGINAAANREEKEATPLGRIDFDVDNLKEFAAIIESTIIPLGETLRGTFLQVADAIGQTVANWVLLGETGPAVMRKILAQALASIAAEAAVNAIKELALGFATLFFNPAESAAHFTAAGLWAAIAGGSALAGRAVAGDLFKSKSGGSGAGAGGGSSSGKSERDPIDLFRTQQQQELHIFLHGEPGPQFRNAVINTFVDDVRSNGPMRTTVKEVTES